MSARADRPIAMLEELISTPENLAAPGQAILGSLAPPQRPFVALPGNGTATRIAQMTLECAEAMEAEFFAPYVDAARRRADAVFLAGAFIACTPEEANRYFRSEHYRATEQALDEFRRDWFAGDEWLEISLVEQVSRAFYWRLDEIARSPLMGGHA